MKKLFKSTVLVLARWAKIQTIDAAISELLACADADYAKQPYPKTEILEITDDQLTVNTAGVIIDVSGHKMLDNGMRLVMTIDIFPADVLTEKEYGS